MDKHIATLEKKLASSVALADADPELAPHLQPEVDAYTAAIALMRGQSWQDIATCPRGDRRVILLISMNGPNGYITDPWTGWMNSDGTFARWPHEFPPTHWRSIEPKYPEKPKDSADEQ